MMNKIKQSAESKHGNSATGYSVVICTVKHWRDGGSEGLESVKKMPKAQPEGGKGRGGRRRYMKALRKSIGEEGAACIYF